MNLCSNDHATVCFDTWDCPLCDMRSELRAELASLRATFDQLYTEFNQLELGLTNTNNKTHILGLYYLTSHRSIYYDKHSSSCNKTPTNVNTSRH